MAVPLLRLNPSSSIRWSFGSGLPRITCGQKNLIPTAKSRHVFVPLSEYSHQRRGFGPGFRISGLGDRPPVVVVAAAAAASGSGNRETSDSDVVLEPSSEPSEESSSVLDLTLHRRDPPNLFLYAAGFGVIMLMLGIILREFAGWEVRFGPIVVFVAEGVAIALGKVTNALAAPISILLSILSWSLMAITDIYTLVVDGAPVQSLFSSLLFSLAVLSVGDATACKIRGSRSRLVGIATVVGLAGVLDYIPAEAVLLCLLLLTAFAKLVQKADLVTVFMPATVTFVAISDTGLRAVAFGAFLAIAVYANWRFGAQGRPTLTPSGVPQELAPSEVQEMEAKVGMRDSPVFSIISVSICLSWAVRLLYLCSVKWLLVRTGTT